MIIQVLDAKTHHYESFRAWKLCITDSFGLMYNINRQLDASHHPWGARASLYSLSGKTSFRQSLEAASLDVMIIESL